MKKQYIKPEFSTVRLNCAYHLLTGSDSIQTNVNMKYRGGSSTQTVRSREGGDFDWE